MAVKWERFVGDTDRFAMRMSFLADPDRSVAVDPDEAVSWGAFQIWVDGQNLCAHVDQGEVLYSAHWYLLPLLEWLADSWNPLLHEERLPNRNPAATAAEALALTRNAPALAGEPEIVAWEEEWYEWRGRHALRAARSGGLLPNVIIRRLRDSVEISWQDEPLAGMPEGFSFSSATGTALLEPSLVAEVLHEILHAAIMYLVERNPTSARLRELQVKLAKIPLAGEHDSRLRWLAGVRTQSALQRRLQAQTINDELQSSWARIVDSLRRSGADKAVDAALATEETPLVITGSCQAALLFGSVAPTISESDVHTLARVLVEQYSPSCDDRSGLAKIAQHVPLDLSTPAWEQGYDLADEAYDLLDADDGWVDIYRIMERLGVDVRGVQLEDTSIRACSIVGPQHRPAATLNVASRFSGDAAAIRFTLAHELCHLMFDRAHGKRLSIASGPWAPRGIEQRANAFAAMLLMPSALVQRTLADLPDPVSDLDGLAAFAERLQVSRRAALEHLYNLTMMSEDDRDALLRQIAPMD